ncbi:plant expansin, partial [Rhodocollybia butyracea]
GNFYEPGLGACGFTNTASQFVAGLGHVGFDSFSNPFVDDGSRRPVRSSVGGKSVTVEIVDRCAGCAAEDDLEFSPAAFEALAGPSVGQISGVTWEFV